MDEQQEVGHHVHSQIVIVCWRLMNMRPSLIAGMLLLLFSNAAVSATLHVGPNQKYADLTRAIADVRPGDTILMHEGTYPGGVTIRNLQGAPNAWIKIFAAPGAKVVFNGGTNGWHMTDAAYLHIRGFVFQHQTGNGFNMDDGGSYETPSHHILLENCTFKDIRAAGNNDLLKMSGVDHFEIKNCKFLNGSFNGSGIDMVGCHHGRITGCSLEYQGRHSGSHVGNGFQAKGGSSEIIFERNLLNNAGPRAFNLGGSTGSAFFRPLNAGYEAASLKVYANIIIGSDAPVAFVGCIRSEVINNTIYLPARWVLRILQENTGDQIAKCGNNRFANNIIYRDSRVSADCNVGPGTLPETFTFTHNLWFHAENTGWRGPSLPVADPHQIVADPLFVSARKSDFRLQPGSRAIGSGAAFNLPVQDFTGNTFHVNNRSRGAIEFKTNSSTDRASYRRDSSLRLADAVATG